MITVRRYVIRSPGYDHHYTMLLDSGPLVFSMGIHTFLLKPGTLHVI